MTSCFTGTVHIVQFYSVYHCVKSVHIRSFFWSVFSRIRNEYGDIRNISPYSVRAWENTDQEKLRIWTLHAVYAHRCLWCTIVSFICKFILWFVSFYPACNGISPKLFFYLNLLRPSEITPISPFLQSTPWKSK